MPIKFEIIVKVRARFLIYKVCFGFKIIYNICNSSDFNKSKIQIFLLKNFHDIFQKHLLEYFYNAMR